MLWVSMRRVPSIRLAAVSESEDSTIHTSGCCEWVWGQLLSYLIQPANSTSKQMHPVTAKLDITLWCMSCCNNMYRPMMQTMNQNGGGGTFAKVCDLEYLKFSVPIFRTTAHQWIYYFQCLSKYGAFTINCSKYTQLMYLIWTALSVMKTPWLLYRILPKKHHKRNAHYMYTISIWDPPPPQDRKSTCYIIRLFLCLCMFADVVCDLIIKYSEMICDRKLSCTLCCIGFVLFCLLIMLDFRAGLCHQHACCGWEFCS